MKPAVAITLIVCGTVLVVLPVAIHFLGTAISDIAGFCYIGLGAIMIVPAVFGSYRPKPRGFDVLPAAA